jgi:L-iditol 2-dehydrogenase
MGATAVFQGDTGDPVAWVMEQTAGRGVDVVFEAAWADQVTTAQAADMVRRGGKMMMVGIPRENIALFPAHSVRRKGVTIKYVRRMKHTYPRAIAMAKDELIDLDTLITHRFVLDEANQAYELVASYKNGVIKAIVEVSE